MYLLNGKALEANLRFYLEKAASEQETFWDEVPPSFFFFSFVLFLSFFSLEREREREGTSSLTRGQSHYVHVESYGHQQSTKRRWSGRFVGQRFNPEFGFLKKQS